MHNFTVDGSAVQYEYNAEKSALLERERGINFDAVIRLIEAGNILNVYDHPNQEKYPHQQIYELDIAGYVYLVPFIRQENSVFLKTIFPSRTATKHYKARLQKDS